MSKHVTAGLGLSEPECPAPRSQTPDPWYGGGGGGVLVDCFGHSKKCGGVLSDCMQSVPSALGQS